MQDCNCHQHAYGDGAMSQNQTWMYVIDCLHQTYVLMYFGLPSGVDVAVDSGTCTIGVSVLIIYKNKYITYASNHIIQYENGYVKQYIILYMYVVRKYIYIYVCVCNGYIYTNSIFSTSLPSYAI